MSAVLCCAEPVGTARKDRLPAPHRIALWDTVKSCEITGSSDASLKNVEVNDIGFLLARCHHPLHLRKRQGFGESVPNMSSRKRDCP
jgi:G:T/U-mismatch repair DNA glycosylase